MKNGFTLIELLAVIVILAIIAIIAVPIVLNIINDSKESSLLRSAEFYLDAVEYTIADAFLYHGGLEDKEYPITPEGNICKKALPCDDANTLKVEVNGDKPTGGYITIDGGNISNVELILSDRTIVKNEDNELVFEDSDEEGLAPGLYDENDNLKISWEDLTSMEYQTITYYDYENHLGYDEETGEYIYETINSAILNVDANGVLTSTYDGLSDNNYSCEYLDGKLVIDDSVTEIGGEAFHLTNLTSVVIPDSVTYIGDEAFANNQLTSVVILDSVINIGCYAFAYNQLTSVTIPNSVTEIGSYAFYDNQLTSVVIPNSVTKIGEGAFQSNQLTSIEIPESVTTIGDCAFQSNQLTSVTIKGKSSFDEFEYYGGDLFEWADGYSDDDIVWQP